MSNLIGINEVQNNIQKAWAPIFTKQLREKFLLPALVNSSYQGQIANQGDTVRVSQMAAPTGQLLTVGTNADSFSPEAIDLTYVDLKCDKRAVASFKFSDLVSLQSQISPDNPEVMSAMTHAINKQINTHIYSLIAASSSAPDHQLSGVSDFNASQLAACRVLAGQSYWDMSNAFALLDPQYHQDLINATTMSSADYSSDQPLVAGQMGQKRLGFRVFEDVSMGADHGIVATPDFMLFAAQTQVQVKISDLHALGQFGVQMSVDIVFGAKLSNQGSVKHIQVYNSAW